MLAIAAEARNDTTRKRRARADEEQGCHPGCDEQGRETSRSSNSTQQASSLQSPADNSSSPIVSKNKPKRYIASAPFQGGRCTFGTRMGKDESDAFEACARRAKHSPMATSGSDPPSAWGQQERHKLNEICECNRSLVVVGVALGGVYFQTLEQSDTCLHGRVRRHVLGLVGETRHGILRHYGRVWEAFGSP